MNRFKVSCLLAEHCKGRQYTKGNSPLVIEKIVFKCPKWLVIRLVVISSHSLECSFILKIEEHLNCCPPYQV